MARYPLYVSVDLEYTDGNFVDGTILQVGLALRTPDGQVHTFSELAHIKPTDWERANPWVRANLGELGGRCLLGGSSLMDLGGSVCTWLRNWQTVTRALVAHDPDTGALTPEVPIVFVGWCGAADWAYLSRAIYAHDSEHMDKANPFHYDTIEIGSLAMGALGLPWGFTSKELAARLGIDPPDPAQQHDALYDARWQLQAFEGLMTARATP